MYKIGWFLHCNSSFHITLTMLQDSFHLMTLMLRSSLEQLFCIESSSLNMLIILLPLVLGINRILLNNVICMRSLNFKWFVMYHAQNKNKNETNDVLGHDFAL